MRTSRSPWLIVTVLLAIARPLCMRSTAISTGASGDPARAKIVCTVLTRFSGSVFDAGDDRLCEQLAAEDHTGPASALRGAIASRRHRLERRATASRFSMVSTALLRREAQRAVEADVLAVEIRVARDRLDEERELLGLAPCASGT